jgi:hypothetical protein
VLLVRIGQATHAVLIENKIDALAQPEQGTHLKRLSMDTERTMVRIKALFRARGIRTPLAKK